MPRHAIALFLLPCRQRRHSFAAAAMPPCRHYAAPPFPPAAIRHAAAQRGASAAECYADISYAIADIFARFTLPFLIDATLLARYYYAAAAAISIFFFVITLIFHIISRCRHFISLRHCAAIFDFRR
jgi:hypothetical protein